MQLPQPFINFLVSSRKAKGWTQRRLAAESGLPPHLIFRLENGRLPRAAEIAALEGALGISFAMTDGLVRFAPLKAAKFPPAQQPERTLASRIGGAKALNYRLYMELSRLLDRRADRVPLLTHLRDTWTDSADEVFFWMDAGVRCAEVHVGSLSGLGFRQHPVVCPKREIFVGDVPLSCLRLVKPFEAILFAQIGLLLQNQKHRVDCLMRVGAERWAVIEVDGDGHRSSWDERRDRWMDMPVVRLSRAEVLARKGLELARERLGLP